METFWDCGTYLCILSIMLQRDESSTTQSPYSRSTSLELYHTPRACAGPDVYNKQYLNGTVIKWNTMSVFITT